MVFIAQHDTVAAQHNLELVVAVTTRLWPGLVQTDHVGVFDNGQQRSSQRMAHFKGWLERCQLGFGRIQLRLEVVFFAVVNAVGDVQRDVVGSRQV